MTDTYQLPHITKEEAAGILVLSGFVPLKWWELANQYWCGSYTVPIPPWWLIKTDAGMIEMGHRKRVLQISWEDTGVKHLVTTDKVTVDTDYVHAYSNADAVKYMTELRRYMTEIGHVT